MARPLVLTEGSTLHPDHIVNRIKKKAAAEKKAAAIAKSVSHPKSKIEPNKKPISWQSSNKIRITQWNPPPKPKINQRPMKSSITYINEQIERLSKLPEMMEMTEQAENLLISKHKVTLSEWESMMGGSGLPFGGDNPVELSDWDDVQKYLKALNQKTGSNYRLPTGAEWGYMVANKMIDSNVPEWICLVYMYDEKHSGEVCSQGTIVPQEDPVVVSSPRTKSADTALPPIGLHPMNQPPIGLHPMNQPPIGLPPLVLNSEQAETPSTNTVYAPPLREAGFHLVRSVTLSNNFN